MNDAIKPNRFKKDAAIPTPWKEHGLYQHIPKMARLAVLICVLSLIAIYAHDAVVQSPFFTVRQVAVSGEHRAKKQEILALAGLSDPVNIFQVNVPAMEKRIASHPWISTASVRRSLFYTLTISVVEQSPLAIVRIENMPDMIINAQGVPFKAYDPEQDHGFFLPVISGLDLTHTENLYHFEGPLFDAVLNLLHGQYQDRIIFIHGDPHMGITIHLPDRFNLNPQLENPVIPVSLGFDNYDKKLLRARQVSQYITANIPGKTICAIDLFDIDTVFVKTADTDVLDTNIEKGA